MASALLASAAGLATRPGVESFVASGSRCRGAAAIARGGDTVDGASGRASFGTSNRGCGSASALFTHAKRYASFASVISVEFGGAPVASSTARSVAATRVSSIIAARRSSASAKAVKQSPDGCTMHPVCSAARRRDGLSRSSAANGVASEVSCGSSSSAARPGDRVSPATGGSASREASSVAAPSEYPRRSRSGKPYCSNGDTRANWYASFT
mmetsp:Transcript_10094/g.31108  ORF Transcript_10094/g.31108 Transcript_10094/m.31108 type:complete len:212 (-) Transcript_10094:290-925(-)